MFYAEGFARLSDIIINKHSISKQNGDVSTLCDTAVAAIGKICEFQRQAIDDPMVIISNLPKFVNG